MAKYLRESLQQVEAGQIWTCPRGVKHIIRGVWRYESKDGFYVITVPMDESGEHYSPVASFDAHELLHWTPPDEVCIGIDCPDCDNGMRMPLLFGAPYPCTTCGGTGKVRD
jgi:hypothetical protein